MTSLEPKDLGSARDGVRYADALYSGQDAHLPRAADWPSFARGAVARLFAHVRLGNADCERTFDAFDDMLGLDYDLEAREWWGAPGERLFQGAGPGTQTSYASIVNVLTELELAPGAHVMDLGSGYGRLGLIAGLWRDDLRATGYEFVGARVDCANAAAARTGTAGRVRFETRDLGRFAVPAADVYYMYDPFCAETYERVVRQLLAHGTRVRVTVVAKASARAWFAPAAAAAGWHPPRVTDEARVLIFTSPGPEGAHALP